MKDYHLKLTDEEHLLLRTHSLGYGSIKEMILVECGVAEMSQVTKEVLPKVQARLSKEAVKEAQKKEKEPPTEVIEEPPVEEVKEEPIPEPPKDTRSAMEKALEAKKRLESADKTHETFIERCLPDDYKQRATDR